MPQGRLQERWCVRTAHLNVNSKWKSHKFQLTYARSFVEEYFDDIVLAYQQEIADLYAGGCRNLQIDDPLLAYKSAWQEKTRSRHRFHEWAVG